MLEITVDQIVKTKHPRERVDMVPLEKDKGKLKKHKEAIKNNKEEIANLMVWTHTMKVMKLLMIKEQCSKK